MLYIIKRQNFSFSVFQPFIANLVTADPVFPDSVFNPFKILLFIDVNTFSLLIIFYFINPLIAGSLKFCDRRIKLGRLHQM